MHVQTSRESLTVSQLSIFAAVVDAIDVDKKA